jgi:hypothetical protein
MFETPSLLMLAVLPVLVFLSELGEDHFQSHHSKQIAERKHTLTLFSYLFLWCKPYFNFQVFSILEIADSRPRQRTRLEEYNRDEQNNTSTQIDTSRKIGEYE